MKKLLTLALLGICFAVCAQEKKEEEFPIPKFTLKWSPLHLFDFITTFQLALEQRVSKNISVQYEAGPVIPTKVQKGTYHDQRGFKAKFDIRFYIKPRTKNLAFYWASGIYYNHVDYKKSETYYLTNDFYYQYITYGMEYRERGAVLKIGSVFSAKRLVIDFHIGVTGGIVTYESINKPSPERYRFIKQPTHLLAHLTVVTVEEDSEKILPTAGVKLGYRIM